MRSTRILGAVTALFLVFFMLGCQQDRAAQSPQENVEQALEQAGMNDVSVNEDADNRVIRLSGDVQTEEQRQRAEQLAQQHAAGWTVANEIGVRPAGADQAGDIASEEDKAIENRWNAEAMKNNLDDVDVRVENGVVTLEGEVRNQQQVQQAEKLAKGIEGVRQVVNNLEVEGRGGDRPQPAQPRQQ